MKAQPRRANYWFGGFGNAFEEYGSDLVRRAFPSAASTDLVRRFVPNPRARDVGDNDVEFADGALIDHESIALIEMKAVWLRDEASRPADPTAYVAELRERYGVTESRRAADRRVRGLRQLARTITAFADRRWTTGDVDFHAIKRIVPILLVSDSHLDAGAHPNFLAEEFIDVLGVRKSGTWTQMMVGPFRVEHLCVLTIDDLELLETSLEQFSFFECMDEYIRVSPDRMTSFFSFLVTSRFRDRLRRNAWLSARSDAVIDGVLERLRAGGAPESSRT